MCSGAIYWAGIGRVVYGQSEKGLKAMTGAHAENPTLDLPCRVVFASGQPAAEVVGPRLEEKRPSFSPISGPKRRGHRRGRGRRSFFASGELNGREPPPPRR